MKERMQLLALCVEGLQSKGLYDENHKARLKREIKAIDDQGEHEYFLDLHSRGTKFPRNEHNLMISYAIGLCDDFNIDEDTESIQGEFPDIDIDYIDDVRDYLKKDWAPRIFGQENICEIGTYGTLGIKSAILDMTGVFGLAKDHIQSITVRMDDKDDEGKPMEWDKALEMYPDFANYCEKNADVAAAAKLALSRNKTAGVHAGGLIIADRRIDEFVPLEVRSVKKETPRGVLCSAWTEGLAHQDLQPVGLIKFDLLVINNLKQIAYGCKMVKERHPEMAKKGISAHPGEEDWSDIAYLNDPKSLKMANEADLKCIFQFDSEGIRKLVKRGGVTCFNDLASYSSLYRPGPLDMGMDARYCKRKQGEEPYNLHPVLQPILGSTYGVMVFQEQVMDILNAVGKIPQTHTEKVRKAMSKKKVADFIKYKPMFLSNGQKVLSVNQDYVQNMWDQIESFSGYGFNKSVDLCTLIPHPSGVKEISSFQPGEEVYCVNEDGETVTTEVVEVHDHGVLDAYEVMFEDGYSITCSADHKFLTEKGQIPLREICRTRSSIYVDKNTGGQYANEKERWMEGGVRSNTSQQASVAKSQGQLSKLPRFDFTEKVGEIQTCCSLRREMCNQEEIDGTSSRMSEVQGTGLGSGGTQISMRERIFDLERTRTALQRLQNLRSDQTREYPEANGKVEQRQRTSRSQEDIFGYGEENFCQTGNTSSTCRTTEEVERGESREVCEMYRSGVEEPQEVSDGSVASRAIGLGDETNTLRRGKKTSRFCERQNLDRSGRILSLLRASLQKSSRQVNCSPTTRRDVEERGITPERCDVDSDRHDLFQEQFRGDARGMVRTLAGHAPITDTGRLASRRIVRVRYVGERRMCDLEVANPTHNFLLPNGIVTSNSHAYAYSVISARLLYLKAHFPIEFYAAIFMCEKEDEKFKDYKLDAKYHDVNINPVHINKSKTNFHIEDDEIYFGFQNIKGVGKVVASRIADNQPYEGYVDFLDRFGTDASSVKATTSLGCFDELEPDYGHVHLRKFHEHYKESSRKRRERQKRFELAMDKKLEELKDLLLTEIDIEDPDFALMSSYTDDADAKWVERFSETTRDIEYKYKGAVRQRQVTFLKLIRNLAEKRAKSIRNFHEKERMDEEEPDTLETFNSNVVDLDEEEEKILNEKLELNGEISYTLAERLYYGFQWIHKLEASPDYNGLTLDRFLNKCENWVPPPERPWQGLPVEIEITSVRKRTSKSGVEFYSVDIEDANAKQMVINVWMDDYIRWREELKKGNMLRIRVRPPSGGFRTLTFEAPPKRLRHKLLPKDKAEDFRVRVMREPEAPKPDEVDLTDVGFDLGAISGLDT